jgi:hypothetical protein
MGDVRGYLHPETAVEIPAEAVATAAALVATASSNAESEGVMVT